MQAVVDPELHQRAGGPASLEIAGVSCRYDGHEVVTCASLSLRPGERAALIGPNGAGKSTLLRTILGLHVATGGRISVDGAVARSSIDWAQRRRRVAWMPQRQATGRFPLRLDELLASSGEPQAALRAARALGLGDLAGRALHTLSGGQLQRAFLARALGALSGEAGLLLADEPTSALDFDGRRLVIDTLARLPATLLVVSHDRALADRCDRVFEMAGGALREAAS